MENHKIFIALEMQNGTIKPGWRLFFALGKPSKDPLSQSFKSGGSNNQAEQSTGTLHCNRPQASLNV
jgi:hypothetical protein